jgi:hypothetical protein
MRTIIPVLPILALVLVPSCQTLPLPEDDIPQDFLFTYTFERSEGAPPEAGAPPQRIHLALDVAGAVHYEADHLLPLPASNTGEFRLEEKALQTFYESIRAVDLFGLPDSYEGSDASFGTRTFFVIGRNTPKTVTAKNTAVAALDPLEKQLLALLPAEVLAYPRASRQTVVLDLRSNFFHLGDCAEVEKIPAASRRDFDDPWAALNAGCRPAECCKPLENFH